MPSWVVMRGINGAVLWRRGGRDLGVRPRRTQLRRGMGERRTVHALGGGAVNGLRLGCTGGTALAGGVRCTGGGETARVRQRAGRSGLPGGVRCEGGETAHGRCRVGGGARET